MRWDGRGWNTGGGGGGGELECQKRSLAVIVRKRELRVGSESSRREDEEGFEKRWHTFRAPPVLFYPVVGHWMEVFTS